MNARDIPVFGGLFDTLIILAVTLRRIARHPFGFVHEIRFDDPEEMSRAFKFIGAGIAVGYLLISPALSKHTFQINELLFGALVLFRLSLIAIIYHIAFLLAGCRRPIKTSLILASYINGIYFPFFMAVMLPLYLAIGPDSYFGKLPRGSSAEAVFRLDDPLSISALLVFLVVYPWFYSLTTYWWAKAYGSSLWLSALLLLLSLVIAGVANLYIAPWTASLLFS